MHCLPLISPCIPPASTLSVSFTTRRLLKLAYATPTRRVTQCIPVPDRHVTQCIPGPDRHVTQCIPDPGRHVTQCIPDPGRHVTCVRYRRCGWRAVTWAGVGTWWWWPLPRRTSAACSASTVNRELLSVSSIDCSQRRRPPWMETGRYRGGHRSALGVGVCPLVVWCTNFDQNSGFLDTRCDISGIQSSKDKLMSCFSL